MFVCPGQWSGLTEQWRRERFLLVIFPPSVSLLWYRWPDLLGPLPRLPDKTPGVASHDLVPLVLWQKTTLRGEAGNHKYLGIKELYGVCCKRIYSSPGGNGSVSKGSEQPVFTASHVNTPTALGQTLRAGPDEHFSVRNANATTSPNRSQKTGVNSVSSWFKYFNTQWGGILNKSQLRGGGLIWTWNKYTSSNNNLK